MLTRGAGCRGQDDYQLCRDIDPCPTRTMYPGLSQRSIPTIWGPSIEPQPEKLGPREETWLHLGGC